MADEITDVNVVITADTAAPTQQGFGTPLFVGYHNFFSDLVRVYTDLSAVSGDGFTPGHSLYQMAETAFSQNPRPSQIMIGRLPTATAKTFTLTVTDATQGHVNTATFVDKSGMVHTVSRTVPAASTTAAEATALATAISTALTGLGAAVAAASTITFTPTIVGDRMYVNQNSLVGMTYVDTSVDAGYPAALNAIRAYNDNWYGLAIAAQDAVNVAAVAAWAEASPKFFAGQTGDSAELGTTGPLGTALKAAQYKKSVVSYSGDPSNYFSAGWLSKMLTFQPGEATWKFKVVEGVAADALSATQRLNLDAVNLNHYMLVANLGSTGEGVAPGAQFADITIGIDWTQARMKEAVFGALHNAPKVPYTDVGLATFIAPAMMGVLKQGVRNQLYAEDPKPTVTMPVVANVQTTDKQTRVLNNAKFYAQLAGAVHKVNIRGTVSV